MSNEDYEITLIRQYAQQLHSEPISAITRHVEAIKKYQRGRVWFAVADAVFGFGTVKVIRTEGSGTGWFTLTRVVCMDELWRPLEPTFPTGYAVLGVDFEIAQDLRAEVDRIATLNARLPLAAHVTITECQSWIWYMANLANKFGNHIFCNALTLQDYIRADYEETHND